MTSNSSDTTEFNTITFIEELQTRPQIYNPSHLKYYSKRKDKLKELGALFDLTGE